MKSLLMLGAALSICGSVIGCAPLRSANSVGVGEVQTARAVGIGTVLAQTGYVGIPMHQTGNAMFVQAKLDTTRFDALLASGAPYDLWLDDSLAKQTSPALRMTQMYSSYWSFTPEKGQWAFANQLTIGNTSLDALEAKVEHKSLSAVRASVGATALMSREAIIDYATDTVYLLAPEHPAAAQPPVARQPTLRAVLENAGQYHTFLSLMDRAGLASFLDSAPPGLAATHSDSIAWIGLRVRVLQNTGVGTMPPNEIHLHLARQSIDQEIHGSLQRTVFAPTDAAFARIPSDTLQVLQADTPRLAELLRAHLYARATIDTEVIRTLIRGAVRTGAQGPAFGFQVLGSRIDVDRLDTWQDGRVVARATIVQPDLKTDHGVSIAQGIDRVLGSFGDVSPIAATLTRQGYISIPLHRLEDGNGYYVSAIINNVPVQLTIDTGIGAEIAVDQKWAAQSQLPQARYKVAIGTVVLDSIQVDTLNLSTSIQAALRQGYVPSVGVIGTPFLARYQARVDFAAGVLYLRTRSASRAQ